MNGDGRISRDEFGDLLSRLQSVGDLGQLDGNSMDMLMDEFDVSGNGELSLTEALVGIMRLKNDVIIQRAFGHVFYTTVVDASVCSTTAVYLRLYQRTLRTPSLTLPTPTPICFSLPCLSRSSLSLSLSLVSFVSLVSLVCGAGSWTKGAASHSKTPTASGG